MRLSNLTLRRAVAGLLGALALLLAGPGRLAAAGQLNIFCWSEYVPASVVESFQKETGIRVSVENYASNEEMLAKLLAGGGSYDLVQPSEYTVEALIKAGLLLPLDRAAISNFHNLDPAFLNQPFDPQNRFSIPWMAGTVGIVINTDRVHAPVEGFADVFSGKYNGRIAVVDDNRELVSWALAYLHLPANDITTATLVRVSPVLALWLPQIKVYDSDSPKTALLSGDVDLGVVWSGEGAILYRDDPHKYKWVLPREGSHRFIDSLAMPKTCTHKAEAQRFINYILRPEISKLISDAFPYTNPNLEARKLLSQAQLDNPASYPPASTLGGLETFRDIGAMSSEVDELVAELKAARR
jgi:spermidine/putrescine transport system substrate-binding protein